MDHANSIQPALHAAPPSPYALGASLYVPASHSDLLPIANGDKLGFLRSVIFCTEDAIADSELGYALGNLEHCLQNMCSQRSCLRFVRVRNPQILSRVLQMPGVEKLTGFVLPKLTADNFDAYFQQIRGRHFLLMPTLETAEVFDEAAMRQLRQRLLQADTKPHILALRIGGNDLLALLGLRRARDMNLYRTPMGALIARLVLQFHPHGLRLTAPVFEYLDNPALLEQEVREDMAHGLVGKTAIHPDQVGLIEHHYRVEARDWEMAERLLQPQCAAVFRMHDAMCEVATHRNWAENTAIRAQVFGLHQHDDAAGQANAGLADNSATHQTNASN